VIHAAAHALSHRAPKSQRQVAGAVWRGAVRYLLLGRAGLVARMCRMRSAAPLREWSCDDAPQAGGGRVWSACGACVGRVWSERTDPRPTPQAAVAVRSAIRDPASG
jgi:hypothetical protein